MALTRVTSSVLDSNAVSAEKIANSALTNRMYGVKSVGLENLQDDANFLVYIGNFNANTNLVENNVRQTSANAAAERANVLTITSNIVQNVANINLNTGTGVRLSQNLAANINQTTANVTAVEARRVANIAGAVSTITTGNLTASRALVSDGSGKVAVSDVTSTELGYVDATSSIQTQLNAGVTKINQTTTNVNQTSTNVAAILAGTTGFTGQVTMADDLVIQGNLTVNGDTTTSNSINATIQDRFLMLANGVSGTPSADVGIFMNRGTSGNAAIFYDESAKSFTMAETRDPDSNTVISPSGLANLAVGTLKYNGADLNTAITDNRSGAISTVYKDNLTASRALASDGSGKIVISDVTSTELGYLDSVTSSIQTQLDAGVTNAAAVVTEAVGIEARRVANIAGAVSTITTSDLTASRALVSDGSGKVAALASVTSTELGYLDATSSIQTQLDSKGSSAGYEANDFVTYTRLNANINLVSSNVAVGQIMKVNVIASTDGEGAGNNNFFIATPPAGNPAVIDNIAVTIDGVTQAKTTDYLYTAGTGKITFKDAAIPTGLTVTITSLNPPA